MTAALEPSLSTTPATKRTPIWARFIPYLGMFVLALILWLPFSFKTTGLIEELGITELMDGGSQLFFVTPTSDLAIVRTRPLQIFPFALAYAFDHNSYLFYNIFMLLFFVGKMTVTYWLVQKFLPGKKLLAFVTGILFTLYPADTGLFALRTIHIHFATVAYLFAFYLLLQFWELRGWKSRLALVGMIIGLTFSLWQYQIALPAALVTPFALLYFTRPTRKFFVAAGAWYGTTLVLLLYALWAVNQSTLQSYEGGLVSTVLSVDTISQMLEALLVGYQRQITSWFTVISKFNYLSLYWPYLLAGVLVCAGVCGWLMRQQRQAGQSLSWRRYALLLAAAALFFAIGVAIYLPIATHRLQDFRIYLLAMFGSAWVLSIALYLLSRLTRRYSDALFIVLALPFVALALLNAFQQQQGYTNNSLEQQDIVQQVVAVAPQTKAGTQFVLLDESGRLNSASIYYFGVYWRTVLRYMYSDQNLGAYYCPPEGGTLAVANTCQIAPSILNVTNYYAGSLALNAPEKFNLSYSNLLLFTTSTDGSIKLLSQAEAQAAYNITGYDPQALIIDGSPPFRTTTLFSCNPALSCYRQPPPVSSLDLDMRRDIGLGWRDFELDGTKDGVFRWSVNHITTVDANLNDSKDLSLEFKVLMWLDETVIDSLKLTVNGQNIPLSFTPFDTGGRIYTAVIPRAALTSQPQPARLVFTVDHLSPVPDAPTIKLGFALSWLHIRPAS